MRQTLAASLALGVLCAVLTQPAAADTPRLTDSSGLRPNHLVRLRIDPTSSVVEILPQRSRDIINSSFTMISANCLDCGSPCPEFERTIQVVLQATTDVDAAYGVSDLASVNYSLSSDDPIQYSTQGALSAGQQITVTVTGDVLSCGVTFKLYFSMCDFAPALPADVCAPEPMCAGCHGEPPNGSESPNTAGAHVVHYFATYDQAMNGCFDCHAPLDQGLHVNGLPSFVSGTDGNGDGNIELSETDICASCHSPDGPYDGVAEAVSNWSNSTPVSCEGCHDTGNSIIGGVQAPATAGNNITFGFYMNGHGRVGIVCVDCHDPTANHIDGEARTYAFDSSQYGPSDSGAAYAAGYRLSSVAGEVPLMIPSNYNITFNYNAALMRDTAFRRCFDQCHDLDQVLDNSPGDGIDSNFKASLPNPPRNYSYAWGSGADTNEHVAHLMNYVGQFADSDWDDSTTGPGSQGGLDTLTTCTTCHNVHGASGTHGSTNEAMIRDGSLAGRTGYGFSYVVEDTGSGGYPQVTSVGATKDNSVGAVLRNNASTMCAGSMCHGDPAPPYAASYDANGSGWGSYLEFYRPGPG